MAIETLKKEINYGRAPGEVEFEFLRAGVYESLWWNNGYRYRIEKDDYLNVWNLYYIFAKHPVSDDGKVQWIRLNKFSGQTTLKATKSYANFHNLNPREKYKFVGRVKLMDNDFHRAKGKLRFKRVLKNDTLDQYSSRYLLPEQIGKVIEEPCTDGE